MGSPKVVKKPYFFGDLKRVKNGLQIAKENIKIYIFRENPYFSPFLDPFPYYNFTATNNKIPKIASLWGFLAPGKDSRTKVVLSRISEKQGLGRLYTYFSPCCHTVFWVSLKGIECDLEAEEALCVQCACSATVSGIKDHRQCKSTSETDILNCVLWRAKWLFYFKF